MLCAVLGRVRADFVGVQIRREQRMQVADYVVKRRRFRRKPQDLKREKGAGADARERANEIPLPGISENLALVGWLRLIQDTALQTPQVTASWVGAFYQTAAAGVLVWRCPRSVGPDGRRERGCGRHGERPGGHATLPAGEAGDRNQPVAHAS